MLYLRALVNFGLNYFFDAVVDIEHAIENSDEASAQHYLARGRCYACLSMFKEAITDLSIAINLNKDLLDVSYLIYQFFVCVGLFESWEMCVFDW